jgi:phage-related protein
MIYRVHFYQTENGDKPVSTLLEALRETNTPLHRRLTEGIRKLHDSNNHGKPLTDTVHGSIGILELRVGSKDIARVFFFFRPNQEIVCTNGYVKKSQKLDPREIERAERYKEDWERRYPVQGAAQHDIPTSISKRRDRTR